MKCKIILILALLHISIPCFAMKKDTKNQLCTMPDQVTLKTRLANCFAAEISETGFNDFKQRLTACKAFKDLAKRKLPASEIAKNAQWIVSVYFQFAEAAAEQTKENSERYQKKYAPVVVAALLQDYPEELKKLQEKK